MDLYDFEQLSNFTWSEQNYHGIALIEAENMDRILPKLMIVTDSYISVCKETFSHRKVYARVHHITSGSHSADSAHPSGKAIDLEVVGLTLPEAIMLALGTRTLNGFSGVGFYPYARHPFVHLDIKNWNRDMRRTVIWYRDVEGEYITSTYHMRNVMEELNTWTEAKFRMDPKGFRYGSMNE